MDVPLALVSNWRACRVHQAAGREPLGKLDVIDIEDLDSQHAGRILRGWIAAEVFLT